MKMVKSSTSSNDEMLAGRKGVVVAGAPGCAPTKMRAPRGKISGDRFIRSTKQF